jgi:hypothetical protein
LNAKIARTKGNKIEKGKEKVFEKRERKVEVRNRCSNKRRHYTMKLSVSCRKINKKFISPSFDIDLEDESCRCLYGYATEETVVKHAKRNINYQADETSFSRTIFTFNLLH